MSFIMISGSYMAPFFYIYSENSLGIQKYWENAIDGNTEVITFLNIFC